MFDAHKEIACSNAGVLGRLAALEAQKHKLLAGSYRIILKPAHIDADEGVCGGDGEPNACVVKVIHVVPNGDPFMDENSHVVIGKTVLALYSLYNRSGYTIIDEPNYTHPGDWEHFKLSEFAVVASRMREIIGTFGGYTEEGSPLVRRLLDIAHS